MSDVSWHFKSSDDDYRKNNSDGIYKDPIYTTQSIRLRFLCPNDIEEIQALFKDLYPIQYPQEWYEQIATPKYYSLVALSESEIVGLIVCEIKPYLRLNKEDRNILPASMEDCDVGYILSLGVHKKFRRKGIGSLLLDTFIHHITASDKQKIKALFLHVLTTNQTAIIFYERRNFRYHSFLPYYYSIRGRSRDAFLYVSYINGGRYPNILDQFKETVYNVLCRPVLWIIRRLMIRQRSTTNGQFKFAQI